jgi:hypothetical protein
MLRADLANRDATAGVLVFARQDQTPDRLIFQTMGDMAIVACEDGDTMALELAYRWARWVACREPDSTGADWTRIQKAAEQGTRALDVHNHQGQPHRRQEIHLRRRQMDRPPRHRDPRRHRRPRPGR